MNTGFGSEAGIDASMLKPGTVLMIGDEETDFRSG